MSEPWVMLGAGTNEAADRRVNLDVRGTPALMKLLRGVAAVGIAKKVYSEARKPQNQARIKSAVAKMRSRGDKPR